jgi:alpha-glucosidase (family GH31 glycosyl hydrolase)
MSSCKDDELATRWVQLAAYSPILRLHSSSSPFNSKEPWRFGVEARQVMSDCLRFRHRLMPYLHTMNYRAARHGEPLIQPVYWDYPDRDEAYRFRNTFNFGTELTVAPITTPRDPNTKLGRVRTWFPPGQHVDIFTGVVYDGDRELWLHRPLDKIPVLGRQGAIVPLDAAAESCNGAPHPNFVEIIIVVGADGAFEMREDDGTASELEDVKWTCTTITFEQDTGIIRIMPCSPTSSEPGRETRHWTLQFPALAFPKRVRLEVDGSEQPIVGAEHTLGSTRLSLGDIEQGSEVLVKIGPRPQLTVTDREKHVFDILDNFQIAFSHKSRI